MSKIESNRFDFECVKVVRDHASCQRRKASCNPKIISQKARQEVNTRIIQTVMRELALATHRLVIKPALKVTTNVRMIIRFLLLHTVTFPAAI